MANVGILGGTFDPPHNAHIAMAQTALKKVPLDRVLLMPALQPPQKKIQNVTRYGDRVEMLRLAIAGHDGLELSRMEEHRSGPSYTVELLQEFRATTADEPFLILGADSVGDLPKWKNPARILDLTTLVVFPRTGYSSVLKVDGPASVVLFESPVIDISSTAVRRFIRAGESVDDLIPAPVRKFILDNGLYS
ncbi:MAG: nicotinate (nicotinamide) nucleotide adenylyltransferase [Candidatus Latescibacterota bacterium]|nr:MAG: nicotinate (nicotinamide) nucleotide adenylyltransferase [Candidatus Latescibacterota bacterium]